MIQLVLLLLSTKYIKRNTLYLSVADIIWMVCELLIFIDGLDNHPYFPLKTFGCILLLESLLTLSVMSSVEGTKKSILFFKEGIFSWWHSSFWLESRIATCYWRSFLPFLLPDRLFITLSSFVVRYPHWKKRFLWLIVDVVLLSLFLLLHHAAAISFFIGLQLIVSEIKLRRNCPQSLAHGKWHVHFSADSAGDMLLSYVLLREGKSTAPVAESKKETPLR